MSTEHTGQKIFIHHDGALGDVLLSLPALEKIRENGYSIHLAGRPDVVYFLKNIGYIHEASDSSGTLFSSLYASEIDDRTRIFLSRFAKAFIFTKKEDSILAAQVRDIIPDTQTVTTIPPEGVHIHVTEFRARQLSERTISPITLEIPLPYQEKAGSLLLEAGYPERERPLVVLHPGSGGKRKCWPVENYFRLIERLGKECDPFLVIISGSAEDREIVAAIRNFSESRSNAVHYGHENLAVVAALLSMSTVYIGNDSGITHLAGAVSRNVAALFGPTDPVLWRPYCKDVTIIHPECECAPCEPRRIDEGPARRFPECGLLCLKGISVEKVYAAIADMICTNRSGK